MIINYLVAILVDPGDLSKSKPEFDRVVNERPELR